MTNRISVARLRDFLDLALANERELAVLDVREAGQYAAGHLFFATHVPYSRLEVEILGFVPRFGTHIVIYDAANGVAEKAASALIELGYTNVGVLDGGAPAWEKEGYTLYEGVNLPSKTFGELVEHELNTPRLDPYELAKMIERGEDFVILDGRTPEEYRQFNIPGGISCPNAELSLRFDSLVSNQETTVVINCAGRTRSIIGAQTLINFGVKNKIFALQNGTQGWVLSNQDLEYGADRYPTENNGKMAFREAQKRAELVSQRFAVKFVDRETLAEWRVDNERTLFLLDVRGKDEYRSGHLAGSQHAPGGQLVQATDRWVGVRGARVVICDDTEVRAISTAHWLKQMGWDVYVLQGGIGDSGLDKDSLRQPECLVPTIDALSLLKLVADDAVFILDLRTSGAFQVEHIHGAEWTVRPNLETLLIPENKEVVLVADDWGAAGLVAKDLTARQIDRVRLLDGGMSAWRGVGGNIVASRSDMAASARIDFVAFTAERHGGNKDHMRQYLEWEINLINQLDDQERSVFKVMAP